MATVTRRRNTGQVTGESIVIEAAWLYYHDGMNQTEIASHLGVSRATVVNYLQEAKERGFIRISLAPKAFTTHRLAEEMRERFGLAAVYVVPDGTGTEEDALLRVARGAAEWLPSLLEPGDKLGVSWGRTVYEMAEAMPQVQTRPYHRVATCGVDGHALRVYRRNMLRPSGTAAGSEIDQPARPGGSKRPRTGRPPAGRADYQGSNRRPKSL